jgi:hypothetical protein
MRTRYRLFRECGYSIIMSALIVLGTKGGK